MNDKSDFELIQLYINGDNRAFEILYTRYRTKLYYFVAQMLGPNRNELDDVVQIVWMRAIDKMPTLTEKGSFFGYLCRTARNHVIDCVRKQKRQGTAIAIDDDESMPIADENTLEPYFDLINIEEQELMNSAIASLSDEQRRIWLLRMENFSFKEIAEKENCSINTALARMSYAKKNIKIFLEKHI